MNKKKICFIAQFPPPIHGLSKAVETLYNSKLAQEFDFEKVDITDNKTFAKRLSAIIRSNADLFYFTISQTKGGNLRDLIILKLLRIQHKKCLIHLHGGYYRQLVDNDLNSWQRQANYKAVKELDGAVVLGNSLKKIFQGMLPDNRIFVVPNCVDDKYLMSDTEFEEKVSTVDKRQIKHILYLSNFIRSKGYPEVLKMAKMEKEHRLEEKKRRFHFDFAGEFFKKTEEEYFFKYIKEYNLDDCITYHGIVNGDKKRALLKMCDAFVLLTRYPNEGQPISILEAMGNGMVIITTDHAGIPDIVQDGINGIIVRKGCSISDIYEALNRLKLSDYARVNRDTVIKEYSEKTYTGKIGKLWSMLC